MMKSLVKSTSPCWCLSNFVPILVLSSAWWWVIATTCTHHASAFSLEQSSKPKQPFTPLSYGNIGLEDELLGAIRANNKNNDGIVSLIRRLEKDPSSVPRPAVAPQVYGRWRLLYTTNAANTSSPIQRRATDLTRFRIYQDIVVLEEQQRQPVLTVRQLLKLGGDGNNEDIKSNDNGDFRLTLDCIARNADYPLPTAMADNKVDNSPRRGDGRIFGVFNILGVSKVGDDAKPDTNRPDARIDFWFDEGALVWKKPVWTPFPFGINEGEYFKLPYPVPFKSALFRDARKGWIDITYLSDRMRIARGNKGTTFVLVKEQAEELG